MEEGELEYKSMRVFLAAIKKEFGEGEEKLIKSGRIEKIRARKKVNGRIHPRIQESSKREQI